MVCAIGLVRWDSEEPAKIGENIQRKLYTSCKTLTLSALQFGIAVFLNHHAARYDWQYESRKQRAVMSMSPNPG